MNRRARDARYLAIAGSIALLLASCGTVPQKTSASLTSPPSATSQTKSETVTQVTKKTSEDGTPDGRTETKFNSETELEDVPSDPSTADIENLTIEQVIRIEEPNSQSLYDNSRYDFPITVNSKVEGWIDYFTGRGRPHMERYLARSSRYIPVMKQILRKAGMPEDLVYLALIESGFNLRAKSRARAVGPWQFVKGTGSRYGLRIDAWIDERRDPIRSTEAAAKYLKDLYLMFESWYLAASAYNAGEYKILRAIESLKTNNYWRVCNSSFFRRETKDYVPKLIAAAIIGKNPTRYGFGDITYQDPLEFDTIQVDFPMPLKEIAKLVDAPEEDLEDLNPELRRAMVPPGTSYEVRIPVGSRVLAERALAALKPKLNDSDLPVQHIVQRGQTLKSIANKYHVRPNDLANANNLSPKERLSPGLQLIIPKHEHHGTRVSHNETSEERKPTPKRSPSGFITHIVRRGESLWTISEKYNVTIQEIFRWNNLKKSRINPGRRLKIKSSGDDDVSSAQRPSHKRRA